MRIKSNSNSQKATPPFKSQNFEWSLVVLTVTVLLLTWHFILPIGAEACPACKEALFDPGQLHQKLSTAKGYALSILLMLSVPIALIGSITTLIVRAQRYKQGVDTSAHSR